MPILVRISTLPLYTPLIFITLLTELPRYLLTHNAPLLRPTIALLRGKQTRRTCLNRPPTTEFTETNCSRIIRHGR